MVVYIGYFNQVHSLLVKKFGERFNMQNQISEL